MSKRILPALVAAALLGLAMPKTALAGEDWAAAFPAEPVATYVQGEELKLVLVAAGEASDDLEDAVGALQTALKAADAVDLVMDDSALGDVSQLDDAAIVAKASSLPVDRVVIVRVFAANSGGTSAVSIYTKDGESAGGFSGSVEKPVKPAQAESGGNAAGNAVGAVMADANVDKEAAKEEFLERVVWFEGGSVVDVNTGGVVGKWSQAYKGKYKEPLYGLEFFEYVGADEELAKVKKYRKTYTIISGSAAVVGAGIAAAGLPRLASKRPAESVPVATSAVITGSIIGGYGLVGLVVRPADPVDEPTRRRLAEEYNEELLDELGLTEDDLRALSAPVRSDHPAVKLYGGAMPLRAGGGLVIGGAF